MNHFQKFSCITKRKLCLPSESFAYHCKFCRYAKCIEIGMSKDKIKMGRYSKKRLKLNLDKLNEIKKSNSTIPYLLNHSDAQDIIITCNQSFSNFLKINWKNEIEDYEETFFRIQGIIKQGFNRKSDFIDILQVTGVEIDYRKEFLMFFDSIIGISFKYFVKSIRNLPVMANLPLDEFLFIISTHRDDFHCLNIIWKKHDLCISLDDNHSLIISKEAMEHVSDPYIVNNYISCGEYVSRIKPTPEEMTFLIALSILSPRTNPQQFATYHKRFVLGFTRYLQSIYHDNYDRRLIDLINMISFLKEKSRNAFKWLATDTNYLECLDKHNDSKYSFSESSVSIFSTSSKHKHFINFFEKSVH